MVKAVGEKRRVKYNRGKYTPHKRYILQCSCANLGAKKNRRIVRRLKFKRNKRLRRRTPAQLQQNATAGSII